MTNRALNRNERKKRMLAMWRDGQTMTKIGEHFGITHQAVAYWIGEECGLGGKALRKKRHLDAFKSLWDQGKSVIEICLATGAAPSTVQGYLNKIGVSTRR